MKAVIYARYSSDNQREESIEGQLRECTAFAEKNGITILRHYIDRAYSAKTDNRPEFQNMIKDSKAIEAIVSQVMDLQDTENTTLPVLETELREVESGIQNILNAIQMGILTKSTKSRLEELETSKEDLEIKIANEKIAKPRISAEFVTFWLHKFRKLDINRQDTGSG